MRSVKKTLESGSCHFLNQEPSSCGAIRRLTLEGRCGVDLRAKGKIEKQLRVCYGGNPDVVRGLSSQGRALMQQSENIKTRKEMTIVLKVKGGPSPAEQPEKI
jgi:hypothetical protein